MKKTLLLFLFLAFSYQISAQPLTAEQKDSMEVLFNTLENLAIYQNNSRFFESSDKDSFTKLEGSFNEYTLEIKKIIEYGAIQGKNGAIERYHIPIGAISRIRLTKDTTPLLGESEHYRISIQFFSKKARKSFTTFTQQLPTNEERVQETDFIEIYSFVKEDYIRLIRIQGILDFLKSDANIPTPEPEPRRVLPILINGIVAYQIGDLDEPPIFQDEKNNIDYGNNIREYIKKNTDVTIEVLNEMNFTIFINSEGGISEVLFMDGYFLGTEEEISGLDSLAMEEYLYYKKTFYDQDPNKDLKAKMKNILLQMPLWTPGKLNGENVNCMILI